ncbi:MAG: radical SAM protein [Phycisphaerae bacterium]
MNDTPLQQAHRQHDRHWRDNAYCYPVVSRRSGGLSIGINLNPDTACNFDCIYCQVDRTTPPAVRKVNLDRLKDELYDLLNAATDKSLFAEAPFDCLPEDQRIVRDIAFSGDGEPTTYPHFDTAVQIAADARQARSLIDTKLVLITDACYLTKPHIQHGLKIMDANNGEIWAKLDAGTEAYYQRVNRPNHPLDHVLKNILDAARVRPVVIQSLWMRVHGKPPPEEEIQAFTDRLNDITGAGGRIKAVQIYTIARDTAEPYATALTDKELNDITQQVRNAIKTPVESFPGIGPEGATGQSPG